MESAQLEEWTRLAVEGDQEAYAKLVRQLAGLIWSVTRSFRLSAAEADDVAQGTWLRLVEHLPTIREPRKLPGWITTTARNECRALLRKTGRLVATDFNAPATSRDLVDASPAADHGLLAGERTQAAAVAFESLGDVCRELLGLLMADPPLTYAEVSEAIGIPVASIGPTRSRCLERLRRHPAILRIS